MATLLTLKRRIKTTANVSKTTKAMQMISASRLKKRKMRQNRQSRMSKNWIHFPRI